MPTMRTTGLTILATGLLLAPLAGCRGDRSDNTPRQFFPDLDHQPRWDPQEASSFFADGRTARVTPAGAVPFGAYDFDPVAHADAGWAAVLIAGRGALLAEDDAVYHGVEVDPGGGEFYIDTIPVAVTRDMIEHGRNMYNIFCVACHGYLGDGKGMVGIRWAYPPANLTGEVYRDRANRQGKDGYIFHIIRDGLVGPDGANRMPGYKHALNPMDAWAVVAYVRALQQSQGASWNDLPPEEQQRLGRPAGMTGDAGGTGMNGGAS
jgi:mono/diheme cytochrome c family protein